MTIYINIWELMKQKGITAVKLAEKAWLTPEHISIMKNKKTTQIRLDTIEKLLIHLDVTPNDLFKIKK